MTETLKVGLFTEINLAWSEDRVRALRFTR
jgi:hypothetical protein